MTLYELTYLLTIIIIFYRAIVNFFIFIRHRTANFLFFFALTEVAFALYLVFVLRTINVPPEQALIFERVQNATIPLIAVFFMIFADKLDRIFKHKGMVVSIVTANCIAALMIMILPGAYHEGIAAPKAFPSLGVTFYETEQPLWVAIFLVFNFALLVYVLIRIQTSGTGLFTRSWMLRGAMLVLALLFLHDILVALQRIHNPYMAHFGFLLTMFSMEYILQVKARGGIVDPTASDDPGAAFASLAGTGTGSGRIGATATAPPEASASGGPATAAGQATVPKSPDRAAAPPREKFARINCLGPLEIFVGEETIRFAEIARKRKLLKLFKLMLVNYGRSLHREAAIEALWPELSEANAYNNLHALCFRLRKFLQKSELVVLTEEQLYFDPELLDTDFQLFENLLDRGLAHYNKQQNDEALATIESATALYRGPFFEFDPYFEPATAQRDHLTIKYRKTLQALCDIYYNRQAFDRVLEYSRVAIDMDDLDEGSWRYHFRGLHLTGRKNEALKKYEDLKKELDVLPDEATEKLIKAIKNDERDPARL